MVLEQPSQSPLFQYSTNKCAFKLIESGKKDWYCLFYPLSAAAGSQPPHLFIGRAASEPPGVTAENNKYTFWPARQLNMVPRPLITANSSQLESIVYGRGKKRVQAGAARCGAVRTGRDRRARRARG